MARIRTIKPEFWASEQVMECSPIARLLFIGLWNFCDDAGNHVDSEKTIKAEIFPGDDISTADVRRMLDELSSNGLIVPYTNAGKGFIHVTGWKHQKIDRPSFKHPPFPEGDSTNIRRTLYEHSPPEGKGREGKGEEEAMSANADYDSADEPAAGEPLSLTQDTPATVTSIASATDRLVEIVSETYHRLLPSCQRHAVFNTKRLKRIIAADKLARQVCKQQGWPYVPEQFWTAYFTECAQDPWMRGERPNPNNPTWKQNIDVLLAEDRFAGVMDRAIDRVKQARAA